MERIPLEMVRELCIGLHHADICGGALAFHRLPPSFLPIYDNEAARIRAECPSGVRIRFVSDANQVAIAVRYGAAARSLYRGTMVVDGDHYPWGPDHQEPEWQGEIFRTEERKDRTFDLWLPHLCRTDLLSLSVNDGAGCRPAPHLKHRWLALGDSITQGMTASLPTRTHTSIISFSAAAECHNLGIGGACFDMRLASALQDTAVDFITVAYGTNDFGHSVPLERVRDGAGSLLRALANLYPQKPVFLITPVTWVDAPDRNELGFSLEVYRQVIREVDSMPSVHVIHGEDMIPDDSTCFVDKVHPNNRGFSIYAQNLSEALRGYVPMNT